MIPFYESVNGGPPEPITALTPAAWYRYGVGITVTGAGVSEWADQSGNDLHLLQGTDAARPALQADNSILFNGTSHYLSVAAWAQSQPISAYLLMRSVTWTATDQILALNNVGAQVSIAQNGTTPELRANSGAALANTALPVNQYGVLAAVYNGASSVFQINTTTTSGDAGANAATVIFLGSNTVPGNYSNIQVKEVILFAAAHDAATRTAVITYLATVGGLNI